MKTKAVGLARAVLEKKDYSLIAGYLARALPALRSYASEHPRFYSIVQECDQDPSGVHALLAEIDAACRTNRRPMSGGFPLPPKIEPLRLGRFTLKHPVDGKLWIENGEGEGMATDEAKLESLLEKFWRKEF